MKKIIQNTIISAIVFFALTMPFRVFFHVMELTEMRPAAAIPPVLGLMLGIPGALGCALGNLIADLISGYPLGVCAAGFPAQFFYGIFPFLIWKINKKNNQDKFSFFRLNNVKNLIWYIVIMITDSLLISVWLGALIWVFGFEPFFSSATLMIFLNNAVFLIILGIPIVVFIAEIKSKAEKISITLNERLVLVSVLMAVVSAGIIGVFSYIELSAIMINPLLMWNRIYSYMAFSIIVIFLITVLVLRYMEKNITVPIEGIANIAKNYILSGISKNEGAIIASECEKFITGINETGTLAKAFRRMTLDLESYINNLTIVTAERERINAELDVARLIQTSMLPGNFAVFNNRRLEFDVYASMVPARQVGGDFYDYFLIGENTLALVIADVSGKGIPAALFMVIAKTLIKNTALSGKQPETVFEIVNKMLFENNDAGMFVTAILGYLEINTGKFTFVNAGHNPPLLQSNNKLEFLKLKPAFVLGGMEEVSFKQDQITLKSGDELFMYTDGITEAMNNEGNIFGEKRLFEIINRLADHTLQELNVSVKNEVFEFACGTEQIDDITMIALRYKGKGASGKQTAMNELNIESKLENIEAVLNFIFERIGVRHTKVKNNIGIAVDEIFSNIARYAYYPDTGYVTVKIKADDDITIEFEDEGIAHNPLATDYPDITIPAEERKEGGLGIFILKKIMDSIEYKRENNKNILIIKTAG